MNKFPFIFALIFLISCNEKGQEWKDKPNQSRNGKSLDINRIERFVDSNKDNGKESKSIGTVSNGKLINGKLMPFSGNNFCYFDTLSYLNDRAFVHNKVKSTILDAYKQLEDELPGRKFYIMECSNKKGGKIFPHKTHQNGLSVDFMMPLMKNNQPYYKLDTIGAPHYWLTFDNNGNFSGDKEVAIDFDLVAQHILSLQKQAKNNGLKISKVIFKIELLDELYSTKNGKLLKQNGIYFAQRLTPLINSLHDDHYHVDFEFLY